MGGGQYVSNINSCLSWQEFCKIMSKAFESRSSSIIIFFRDMEIIIRRNRVDVGNSGCPWRPGRSREVCGGGRGEGVIIFALTV